LEQYAIRQIREGVPDGEQTELQRSIFALGKKKLLEQIFSQILQQQ
jgi:hypothetical protein